MKKAEIISKVNELLRKNDERKPVSLPKHKFYISDDEGNVQEFSAKKVDKSVIYTTDDVRKILDAFWSVVEEAVANGEDVNLFGYGSISVKYRAGRPVRNVDNGEMIEIEPRYVPQFKCGTTLKMAALRYGDMLRDKMLAQQDFLEISGHGFEKALEINAKKLRENTEAAKSNNTNDEEAGGQ